MSSPKTTEPTLPIHHDSEVADYDDGDVTRRNEEEAAAATGTEAQFEGEPSLFVLSSLHCVSPRSYCITYGVQQAVQIRINDDVGVYTISTKSL